MGCMQDKAFDLEFNFSKEMASKNQIFEFNPENMDIKNPASLSENALLNDEAAVVELKTEINDIEPETKANLLKLSNKISRHAINKIADRGEEQSSDKIVIPPKLIKKVIKSA